MVTLRAGPLFSIGPPRRYIARLPTSRPRGQKRAQPDSEIAERHTGGHVQDTHPARAIAHRLEGLVFETRKVGVAAQDSDYQEQPPVWVPLRSSGQDAHE